MLRIPVCAQAHAWCQRFWQLQPWLTARGHPVARPRLRYPWKLPRFRALQAAPPGPMRTCCQPGDPVWHSHRFHLIFSLVS